MIKTFTISGMTCGGCVKKIEDEFLKQPEIENIEIKLSLKLAKITFHKQLPLDKLNQIISSKGPYSIVVNKMDELTQLLHSDEKPSIRLSTYKPLFLIVLFIAGVALLSQFNFESFSASLWMRHFMAGFFIVFSFFKLLNLQGFSDSYRMYDVVAAKWKPWSFIYPFVELFLGVLYLINVFPVETNIATVVILGISSIGVIQSNLSKRKIKCACLGDVFNLPMSTVTIVENLAMIIMALLMLFL
jgi:copper chaperone CopZ